MTSNDRKATLRYIRDRYGLLIEKSAARHGHRPEVVAGIMMRETEGGLSKWLDKPGPEGRGDGGHGHGLMQIDDRSFPDFCEEERWQDPVVNIDFACRVLWGKRVFLQGYFPQLLPETLERAAVAAYNCGEGNVRKALAAGQDLDVYTTGHDYSRCVLEFAQAYLELAAPPAPEPVPVPEPTREPAAPQRQAGAWGAILTWLMKILVKPKQA